MKTKTTHKYRERTYC